MSWNDWHRYSERLAAEAETARRDGAEDIARRLFGDAAAAEEMALCCVDPAQTRTLGVTVVSCAWLMHKAGQGARASGFAQQWIRSGRLPRFAVSDLQPLLGPPRRAPD